MKRWLLREIVRDASVWSEHKNKRNLKDATVWIMSMIKRGKLYYQKKQHALKMPEYL